MRRSFTIGLAGLLAAATVSVVGPPATAAAVTVTHGCVQSRPDPGKTAPVPICYTLFKPATASAQQPVPIVLHSHGWGGSRTKDPAAFTYLTDAGFGVLSFDQRGFGESGGQAYVENPDVEGRDVQRIIDLAASQRWVRKQRPGDPVLGAIGGSYGGGYQFVGAFSELRDKGYTRFDALVPEITWYDLTESLFPQGVARAEWASLLTVAAQPSNALPPVVIRGFTQALATGNVPTYLHEFMARNGPAWHVRQGRRLNVPVLFGQGATDNLFPLDQGLKNFQRALTPQARARSIFVGYNGGHNLPALLPGGTNSELPLTPAVDPCSRKLGSPTFADLGLRFLQQNLQGRKTGLTGFNRFHLATAGGRCVSVPTVTPTTEVRLGDVVSTVGVGVPISYPVAQGPITVAGTPTLDATVSTLGVDNRAFLALSVGSSPLTARIVQNNMLPVRENGLVINKPRTGIELPSVAVDVPAGKTLFLTVSPVSDMSLGFGSRVPGTLTMRNVELNLPVVR